MRPAYHQAGDVRDVRAQFRPHFVGDFAELREVELTWVSSGATPDDLRLVLERELAHFGEVDQLIALAHIVANALEVLARDAHGRAVRQVPTRRQTKAHDRVVRLAKGQVHREIRRAAAVRLHVDVVHAEQRLQARHSEVLDLVDDLLAFVVTLARVTFAVLVGQNRAGRFEHGTGDIVLAGDQPQLHGFPDLLFANQAGDIRVTFS